MITSPHFWLRLSTLCLGLWGCGWLVSVVWRRKRESGLTTPIVTMNLLLKQKARTALTNTAKIGTGMALGVLLGMGIRDRQLINHSHTYWDVAILDKYSDVSFRIQPARMQDGQWDFCDPAPFQKHDELRYITFEQQNGCKRLEYFQKLDPRLGEKLNARISAR